MQRSMTGFACCERSFGDARIAWRIKSVNHRFFDLALRMPEGCDALQSSVTKLLKERFFRGHLECVLSVSSTKDSGQRMELDPQILLDLISLEQRVLERLDGTGRGRISMDRLLSWPGIIRERQIVLDLTNGEAREVVLEVLAETVQELDRVRQAEGRELALVMNRQLEHLQEQLALVAQRMPHVREVLESRLRARVAEYAASLVHDDRLAQELAFLLQRHDIVEEMDRMAVHIRELTANLNPNGMGTVPVGRRLDFLCQELHREANTVCSKAQDGDISHAGVEIKVLVEQLREQAQNLE